MPHSSRAGRPAGRTSISRRLLALADGATDEHVKLRCLELAAQLATPPASNAPRRTKRAAASAGPTPAAATDPATEAA